MRGSGDHFAGQPQLERLVEEELAHRGSTTAAPWWPTRGRRSPRPRGRARPTEHPARRDEHRTPAARERAIAARGAGAGGVAAISVPSRSHANAGTARGKPSGRTGQPLVDETRYCGDVRDLLWLELLPERRHAALPEGDSLDGELVRRLRSSRFGPTVPLDPAADSVWHAPQPPASKTVLRAAASPVSSSAGRSSFPPPGRLLGDRALDRLGRRRHLSVAAADGDERDRREQQREDGERATRIARSLSRVAGAMRGVESSKRRTANSDRGARLRRRRRGVVDDAARRRARRAARP